MEEQIEKLEHGDSVCDVERLKQEHLTQIGFFQHERLIHLIVTVLFALLEALSVMIVLISGEVCGAGTSAPVYPALLHTGK